MGLDYMVFFVLDISASVVPRFHFIVVEMHHAP